MPDILSKMMLKSKAVRPRKVVIMTHTVDSYNQTPRLEVLGKYETN